MLTCRAWRWNLSDANYWKIQDYAWIGDRETDSVYSNRQRVYSQINVLIRRASGRLIHLAFPGGWITTEVLSERLLDDSHNQLKSLTVGPEVHTREERIPETKCYIVRSSSQH